MLDSIFSFVDRVPRDSIRHIFFSISLLFLSFSRLFLSLPESLYISRTLSFCIALRLDWNLIWCVVCYYYHLVPVLIYCFFFSLVFLYFVVVFYVLLGDYHSQNISMIERRRERSRSRRRNCSEVKNNKKLNCFHSISCLCCCCCCCIPLPLSSSQYSLLFDSKSMCFSIVSHCI